MFEQYVPLAVGVLVTTMLVTLVVLAVVLASMDPRGLVYRVVIAMGATSVITASLAGLLVLFLVYGPVRRDPTGDTRGAGSAAEHIYTGEEPRATIIEAYPHEPSDLSTYPLVHATPDDERD